MRARAGRAAAPDLTPHAALLRGLGSVERRLRLQEAVRGGAQAAALALGVAVLLALAARATPLLAPAGVAGAALALLAGLLAGRVGLAWWRPRPRLEIARRADAALALDEKTATAVEAGTRPPPTGAALLLSAQLADAAASLGAALPDLPARLPLRPPRAALGLPCLLLVLFGVALLAPNPLQGTWDAQAALHAQQQAEAAKIEQLRKDLAARGTTGDPARQALLDQLTQLRHDLQAGDLTRDAAAARLSAAEAALQQQLDPRAPGEQAGLDALARRLAADPGPLHDAGQALGRDDPAAAAQAIQQAAGDLAKLTPAQRQALAQQLAGAAADATANDPALARRLDAAARALAGGDTAAAQAALKDLAQQVDTTGQQLLNQQDVNKALSQIQASKNDLTTAGQQASAAQTPLPQTPLAQTPLPQTPLAEGTPLAGRTPLALGTPPALGGTPLAGGTPLTLGSPVALAGTPPPGTPQGTGTPVLVPGTPGQGTPVLAQGQGSQGTGGQQGQGQPSQGGQSQPGQGAGTGGSGVGNQHVEPVAVPPSTLNAQGTPVGLPAKPNTGDTGVTGVNANPGGGAATVPYQDVYGSYQQAAQKTLDTTYIPAGMKDLVRRYFTAIEPGP